MVQVLVKTQEDIDEVKKDLEELGKKRGLRQSIHHKSDESLLERYMCVCEGPKCCTCFSCD